MTSNSGYLKFHAYFGKRGTMKNIYVHRAVCEAYHGVQKEAYLEVRHLDGDKLNNSAINLSWGTSLENSKDQVAHGTSPRGEVNSQSRFIDSDIKRMRRLRNSGASCAEIAREYNTYRSNISRIVRGISWGHV